VKKRIRENIMHIVLLKDVDKYVKICVPYVCTSGEFIKYSLLDSS